MKEKRLHKNNSRQLFILFVISLFILLLTSIVALANENKVTVLADTLNVRYGPGLSHEIITQVQADDELAVLGEENEWYKVRLQSNTIGWVASWLVENEEVSIDSQVNGHITGSEVNVRQFSTTDSAVLGTVYRDEEYQILYRENDWVQILYQNRVAWIHSDYIEVLPESTGQAVIAAESERDKKVRIGLNPTNIRTEPSTEAAVLTTINEATVYSIKNEVDDWYEIELNDGQVGYVANWVTELVSDESPDTLSQDEVSTPNHYATNLSEATIVIDAGHGGHDPGAVASNGFVEKDVALDTATLLAGYLRQVGTNVILTRDDDSFITLNDRVYMAHQSHADAFISIHYDAVEAPNTMSGTTTYYYSQNEKDLADTVNHYLDQYGPLPNNGVRHGNYFVLRQNAQPAILLELGYLDNDHDITVVNTHQYQNAVADAIFQALSVYFSP